jgi:bacterioferritin-associated ferredoxin
MIVCVCNAVSDREIRAAVAAGAHSFAEVQAQLGVATCCGRCRECAARIVDDALHAQQPVSLAAD